MRANRRAVALILYLVLVIAAMAKAANADNLDLIYDDGHITCNISKVALGEFLTRLTEIANLQLIIVEPIDPADHIRAQFDRKTLDEVLKTVLKEYSYALVTLGSDENRAELISYNSHGNAVDGNSPNWNRTTGHQAEYPYGMAAPTGDRGVLTDKIEALKQRIESGASDDEYEKWAQYRDPKFIVHDRDILSQYRRRLSQLRK